MKRKRLILQIVGIVLFTAVHSALPGWAAEGGGAPFTLSGVSVTDFGINDDKAYDLAVQADGKIVVVGTSNNSSDNDMAVARYLEDGTLDREFNSDGRVTVAVGNSDDAAYSVAIQKDGKIVLAGSAHSGADDDFAVIRLTKDGYLDKEFDGDGQVVISFGIGDDSVHQVVALDDGRIIAAGVGESADGRSYAVVQFNADGSLDKSFGDKGKCFLVGDKDKAAYAMVLQNDGKILLGGYQELEGTPQATLYRLQKDGTVDTTFGKSGIALVASSDKGSAIYGLALQKDTKIDAVGYLHNGNYRDMLLTRLSSNGGIDETFGNRGAVVANLGYDSVAYSVAERPDSSIVSVGFGSHEDNKDVVLVYYNSEGGLQSTSVAAGETMPGAGQEGE